MCMSQRELGKWDFCVEWRVNERKIGFIFLTNAKSKKLNSLAFVSQRVAGHF